MQGGARGADALAKYWAKTHPEIARWEYKAEWKKYGPAAGPIRNERMPEWDLTSWLHSQEGRALRTGAGWLALPASRLSSHDLALRKAGRS